jgi:DNA-3-methyladenine glycosylase
MLNVSAEDPGVGAGVLLRALQPLEGNKLMQRRRRTDEMLQLTTGPGRLTEALQIDHRLNGIDLCADGPLWLGSAVQETGQIGTSIRIGIKRDMGRLLRFFELGNPYVSGPTALKLVVKLRQR